VSNNIVKISPDKEEYINKTPYVFKVKQSKAPMSDLETTVSIEVTGNPCRLNEVGFPYSEYGGIIKVHKIYTQATVELFKSECALNRRPTFVKTCTWCVIDTNLYTLTFTSPDLVSVLGDFLITATYRGCS